jgi:hypothetical protein
VEINAILETIDTLAKFQIPCRGNTREDSSYLPAGRPIHCPLW